MPKIPVVKSKDFLKYLLKYNCKLVGIKGSHHKVLNENNNKISIVPVHGNKDLPTGLFAKVLKDLKIDIESFLDFMENN